MIACSTRRAEGGHRSANARGAVVRSGAVRIDRAVSGADRRAARVRRAELLLHRRARAVARAHLCERRDVTDAFAGRADLRRAGVGAHAGVRAVAGAGARRVDRDARGTCRVRRAGDRRTGAGVVGEIARLALTAARLIAAQAVDAIRRSAFAGRRARRPVRELRHAATRLAEFREAALRRGRAIGAAPGALAIAGAIDALLSRAEAAAVARGTDRRDACRAARVAARRGRAGVHAADARRPVANTAARGTIARARRSRRVRLCVHDRRAHAGVPRHVACLALFVAALVAAHLVDAEAALALPIGAALAAASEKRHAQPRRAVEAGIALRVRRAGGVTLRGRAGVRRAFLGRRSGAVAGTVAIGRQGRRIARASRGATESLGEGARRGRGAVASAVAGGSISRARGARRHWLPLDRRARARVRGEVARLALARTRRVAAHRVDAVSRRALDAARAVPAVRKRRHAHLARVAVVPRGAIVRAAARGEARRWSTHERRTRLGRRRRTRGARPGALLRQGFHAAGARRSAALSRRRQEGVARTGRGRPVASLRDVTRAGFSATGRPSRRRGVRATRRGNAGVGRTRVAVVAR